MAKSRAKTNVLTGTSREEAEEAMALYAEADARLQKTQSKMDVQITKIRESNQREISELNDTKEDAMSKIQAYAENNRDAFGNKKSLEMAHGIIGFRTGTPKLKTLKGFTWPSVLNLMKQFMPTYVRTVEEPAKDRILLDREELQLNGNLQKVGLYSDQDESFYIELKKELQEA